MKTNRKHFAPGTLVAPVPPAMVTVGDFDNANIITIAWTGILNSQPPKTYVSIRPSRHSYGILKEINILYVICVVPAVAYDIYPEDICY